jgi:glucosyl-3-phosphoglycerate synthase
MTPPRDDTVRSLAGPEERALADWWARCRFHADDFDTATLRAAKARRGVAVIVPVRECAATIGPVLERAIAPHVRDGLVDEVVVVDAGSRDGTAAIAAAHGVRVVQQDDIAPELGPALGKGDAMWRALQVTGGELVCFMDGDTVDPDPAHLRGLLGPLLCEPQISFVKGAFERPFASGDTRLPHEGGRVTELMARPLINYYVPLLAGFSQPLAGEFAARRDLLEEICFPVGYGVEIATLVDALRSRGLDALAECQLGTRQNRHQPLRALGEMAYAVLAALELRLPDRGRPIPSGRYVKPWDGGAPATVPVSERPPVREHAASRRAARSETAARRLRGTTARAQRAGQS